MNPQGHVIGVGLTVLLHLGLAAAAIMTQDECGWGGVAEADDDGKFKNARVIEAGLARKAVEPKNKQPQKQKKQTFKPPDAVKIATENAVPAPEPDKKSKVRVEPDEIDPLSVLDKNRPQDPDLGKHGSDEVPVEGAADGSEWGTEKQAKGDPYVGELKGRIHSVWQVPSLETGAGKVQGCVRLDENGKIVDREVRRKSSNANLNRSVHLALKNAPDMDDPVPDRAGLKELLTVSGVCFEFNLEEE
jgi:hypothetical protein